MSKAEIIVKRIDENKFQPFKKYPSVEKEYSYLDIHGKDLFGSTESEALAIAHAFDDGFNIGYENGKKQTEMFYIPPYLQPLVAKTRHFECPDGWWALVAELDLKLSEIDVNYKVAQIKSKFGGLRFYLDIFEHKENVDYETFNKLIDEAEEKSTMICEITGLPGQQYNVKGWIWTLSEVGLQYHLRRKNLTEEDVHGLTW